MPLVYPDRRIKEISFSSCHEDQWLNSIDNSNRIASDTNIKHVLHLKLQEGEYGSCLVSFLINWVNQ